MQNRTKRCLIPQFIDEAARRREFEGKITAATLLADISGFTALTQAMMNYGVEGAEIVAEQINCVFTPAIEVIEQNGGFVAGFAGDAFTAIFPRRDLGALQAAERIRRHFEEHGVQQTKFGEFPLSVHIGVSHGTVKWRIIPTPHQHAYWFAGEALKRSGECEQRAEMSQIVFDSFFLRHLPETTGLEYQTLPDGYLLLTSVPEVEISPLKPQPRLQQAKFIPRIIREMKSPGEFRYVLSCFINLQTEDPSNLVADMMPLCQQFGGYFKEVDFGDKGWVVVVLFGAPTTQEKMIQRAAEFALEVKKLAGDSCRIGLTLGRAFTGFVGGSRRSTYAAVGSSVNLAARLMTSANWGEIMLGPLLNPELQQNFEITSSGVLTLKGIAVPLTAHLLVAKKETGLSNIFSGVMVGRDKELDYLSKLIKPLKKGKFSGIVTVYGEPGIGKSRLIYELTEQSGIKTLTMQCESILKKSLNPFSYLISNYFNLAEAGTLEDRKSRYKEAYNELIGQIKHLPENVRTKHAVKELHRIESIIGSVIGLFWENSIYDIIEAKDKPFVTRMAIKEFFLALSLIEPTIIFIEDIQWIDDESQAVFELLTRKVEDYPIIILVSSRFHDDGSKPKLKADEDVVSNEIVLGNIEVADISRLIDNKLGLKADKKLADYITSRTEGNPFYIEQFCLYLKEGAFIELKDDRYVLIGEIIGIPTDINMLLIARIDQLSVELKEMVQIASVLGREFEIRILRELIGILRTTNPEIQQNLKGYDIQPLVTKAEAENIWSILTELRYIFSHALLRDAAYEMQLKAKLRRLHKTAGEIYIKLYPEEKEFYADVAYHFEKAGDLKKAIEYANKAGQFYEDQIRYEESYKYFNKSLSICIKMYGQKDLETARSLNNLGRSILKSGDYKNALVYLEKALHIREELLEAKHLDLAESYNNLGFVKQQTGDYDSAIKYHEKALAIRIELLGEKHRDITETRGYIGELLYYKGDFDKSLEYLEEVRLLREEILGEKHPDTTISYNDLGIIYWCKGDYEEALKKHEKALAIRKMLFGEKHPFTALSYSNIGLVYSDMDQYDMSLKYHKRAHSIRKELLGEKHPDTTMSYGNIGQIYSRKGDFDTALKYLWKTLSTYKEVLGEKHPETALTYNNIGYAYFGKCDYDNALKYHKIALAIRKEKLGEKHSDTAISYDNIGVAYAEKMDYDTALEFNLKAHSIFVEILGEEHHHTTSSCNILGTIYRDKGEYDKALTYHLKALDTIKKMYGLKNRKAAVTLNNIGLVYGHKKEFNTALAHFKEAHHILEDILGIDHPTTAINMEAIASIYVMRNKYSKALPILRQVLAVFENFFSVDHPKTQNILNHLVDIYKKTGDNMNLIEIQEKLMKTSQH